MESVASSAPVVPSSSAATDAYSQMNVNVNVVIEPPQQKASMQTLQTLPPLTIKQEQQMGDMPGTTATAIDTVIEQEFPDQRLSMHHDLTEAGTNPNIQAADSNSQKQTFVPCKVCGDKASGYHYGVTSCEGCKGFFRRSIQKQIEYRCLKDGKCLVIRLNRNRCQYCRFKKCLDVGMSRDSVRYGRVPKRSRSQDEQRVSTTDSSLDHSAIENKQLAIYDIILTISQAHHANCISTEDKVKLVTKAHYSLCDNQKPVPNTLDALEEQRCSMWQNIAILVTPTIQRVVEFAKRIPGFPELGQDDQLILIKSGFFEIWLTRLARLFNSADANLMFGDGKVIPRTELEIVYSAPFVQAMYDFALSFSNLNLNDTEVGLYTGIVLATSDRAGLVDVKAVEVIQDKLIEALKLQVTRNHSNEPNLFANILIKLPELRTVGMAHMEQLQFFRSQWMRMKLPPLLSEIFDIPKAEEMLLQG